jgi:hypothetical protein
MKQVNSYERISAEVTRLKQQRDMEFQAVKYQIKSLGQSLKPGNLLRHVGSELYESPVVKRSLITALLGVSTTWLLARLFKGKKREVLKDKRSDGIFGMVRDTGISVFQTMLRQGLFALGTYLLTQVTSRVRSVVESSRDADEQEHEAAQAERPPYAGTS